MLIKPGYHPPPKVISIYTQPHRHYHDIHHIYYMLRTLDAVKDKLFDFSNCETKWHNKDFAAAYWAVVYHDIVYNIPDPDKTNEQLSAAMFMEDYGSWDYAHVVEQAILATRTHILPEDASWVDKVLIDLDLWGLSDESVYLKNNKLIQKENNATDEQWKVGRGNWLENFLKRDRIYYTPVGMEREAKNKILEEDLNNLRNG